MKKLFILFIIIFSLKAYPYEVGPSYVLLTSSYQRGDFSSSIKDTKIHSFYREKIKNIDSANFSFDAQSLFMDSILLQLQGSFAFGSSHKSYINLQAPVGERPFALSALANFSYDSNTFKWNIKTKLGYHYRLGAIVLQPKIGFAFTDLQFTREKLSPYPINVQNITTLITGTIFPFNDTKCHFYSPLIGLDLIFLIDPHAHWNLLASYEYLIGPADYTTYYLVKENVTTATSSKMLFYKEKQKSSKAADGHFLDLGIRYGINRWFFFGLGFQYEHFRIFSGNINDEYTGYIIENNNRIDSNFTLKPRLSHLRYQSMNFYLSLALQY